VGSFEVVLEKDVKDQLYRSSEICRSITKSQRPEEYPMHYEEGGGNCVGNILRRNCLLQYVSDWKIEGRIEVTGKVKKKT
jgi:hypothetical protein